jgi:hypothetical protein
LEESYLRIIDANTNRLREGIRVVEDIFRYIYDNKDISSKLKNLRHKVRSSNYQKLLLCRNIKDDCLKDSTKSEISRKDINDILISNFKRAQESSRVLEEITKLNNIREDSEVFKNIRYELYDIEKVLINLDNR